MTCKDCIYSPICKLYADFGVTDVPYDENDVCKLFRSKIDVVEVVRCSECLHFLSDTEHCKKHNKSYCEFDNAIKTKNHFCSYGERRSK
jgi:hypothetical protein